MPNPESVDRDFLRFLLGFVAIIVVGMFAIPPLAYAIRLWWEAWGLALQ